MVPGIYNVPGTLPPLGPNGFSKREKILAFSVPGSLALPQEMPIPEKVVALANQFREMPPAPGPMDMVTDPFNGPWNLQCPGDPAPTRPQWLSKTRENFGVFSFWIP